VAPWSEEWEALWKGADIFVFPSRLETYGIVVLEALAFQVPVIATDVGAVAELLVHGRAGYILDSLEELGATIEHVLDRPEEAASKAAFGHEEVRAHYSVDVLGARFAEVLRAVHRARAAVP
jgi:glycosyltransferase involved in cell wall biosynthesis